MKKFFIALLICLSTSLAYAKESKVNCVGNNQTDKYACTIKYQKGIFDSVYTLIPAVGGSDETIVRIDGKIQLYEKSERFFIKLYYQREFGSDSNSSYDAKWLKAIYHY